MEDQKNQKPLTVADFRSNIQCVPAYLAHISGDTKGTVSRDFQPL